MIDYTKLYFYDSEKDGEIGCGDVDNINVPRDGYYISNDEFDNYAVRLFGIIPEINKHLKRRVDNLLDYKKIYDADYGIYNFQRDEFRNPIITRDIFIDTEMNKRGG